MAKTEYVYGIHAVATVIKLHPEYVLELFLTRNQDKAIDKIKNLALKQGLLVETTSKAALDKRVGDVNHQSVVLRCKALPRYQESDIPQLLERIHHSARILILDGVQDPHNLGACLRTANALGVDFVIAPKDKACGLTATVRKVACGAAELTPFVPVTNLVRTMKLLQEQGVWLVGATANADSVLSEIDLCGDIAIVMGAEGTGLRRLTEKQCDYLVRIDMVGAVESLNVSVAAGMCLYEVLRQRRNTADLD